MKKAQLVKFSTNKCYYKIIEYRCAGSVSETTIYEFKPKKNKEYFPEMDVILLKDELERHTHLSRYVFTA